MILVINAGSSSIKFTLFNKKTANDFEVLAKGLAERIGIDGSFSIKFGNNAEITKSITLDSYDKAIMTILNSLVENKLIKSFDDIKGVGHRVVHGGPTLTESKFVDDLVYKQITESIPLAPLQNPANVAVIDVMKKLNKPNVAVFDTSFHTTIPLVNSIYPLPRMWYDTFQIKKYGFHGTSYRFVLDHLAKLLKKPISKVNAIICHLGNGSSIVGIKNGQSFITSMGFTPLEGLMMGTRSGDIDPAIISYVHSKTALDYSQIFEILNKKSGLLGISNISSDIRDITNAANKGDANAVLALQMYAKRIAKYISTYQNELENKVDALVFTGGIGENSLKVRELVSSNLFTLETKLDDTKNSNSFNKDIKISTDTSKVPWFAIRTDEEKMICMDTYRILKQKELI